MHESFGERVEKNTTRMTESKDGLLGPIKVKEKPAAMTSLNFYSSKGTTARSQRQEGNLSINNGSVGVVDQPTSLKLSSIKDYS